MGPRLILLTGASGFIGSHLLPRLSQDAKVRCLVRPNSAPKIPKNDSIELLEGDIRSEDDVRRAMKGVDAVIHLAALLRKCSPQDIYRTNVSATELLVREARKNTVKKFVYVSTENALREDLTDPYAATKRQAEAAVAGFPDSVILRPCFVYGEGDDHGLGRLVSLVKKYPILPLFGGLKSRVQPLWIGDMVEYLIRALGPGLSGAYVLAGPDEIDLNGFLKKVSAVLGKKRLFLPAPYPLLSFSAVLGDLVPSCGWGRSQLGNIYFSRTYSIKDTVDAFRWEPIGLEEGLKKWLKKR